MSQDNQPDDLVILKAKVTSNPNNLDDMLNLADAYRKRGCHYDAIDTYKRAIVLVPDDACLYHSLGTIYEDIGNIDEAKSAYVKAITSNPKYSKAYDRLGSIYDQQQRSAEAIRAYEKCLKYSPDPGERLEVKEKLRQLTSGIPTTTGQSHLAYRLAAIVLFLGALISFTSFWLHPQATSFTIVSAVIDVPLAIGMLQFRSGARNFTLFRAIMGAVLGPILIFMRYDIASALIASVIQWGYCGSIILLLTGQTKTWRLVSAMGLAVVVLGCNGLSTLLVFLTRVIEN